MSSHLESVHPHEQVAINECVARLREAVGGKLIAIWPLGSKARGDSDPDSEIDLLAVIQTQDWDVWHTVRRTAPRQSLEHHVRFNVHIVDLAFWRDDQPPLCSDATSTSEIPRVFLRVVN